MRESLFRVIHRLESGGWLFDAELIKILRKIAETEEPYLIDELLDAFRHA